MAVLSISFGKDLAPANAVALRTLGTFTHNFQLALNRVYLDVKYGRVEKYSRMARKDYQNFDFWLETTRQGSLIADFLSRSELGNRIATRFAEIVGPTFQLISDGATKEAHHKSEYLESAKSQLAGEQLTPKSFQELLAAPPVGFTSSYAEKSTLRNLSTALTPVRAAGTDGEIGILVQVEAGTSSFAFDKYKAAALHRLMSNRQYLEPVIYYGRLFTTDSTSRTGTFYNIDNGFKQQRLLLSTNEEFDTVNKLYADKQDFHFLGMPCVESGSLDLGSGDVLYVGLANVQ